MSATMHDLMQQVLETPGWAALQDLHKKAAGDQKRMVEEARSEAAVVHAALATPEGHRFLLWLMKQTLLRPPGEQEFTAASAETYAIAKAKREGQNSIVIMILSALDVAREGK